MLSLYEEFSWPGIDKPVENTVSAAWLYLIQYRETQNQDLKYSEALSEIISKQPPKLQAALSSKFRYSPVSRTRVRCPQVPKPNLENLFNSSSLTDFCDSLYELFTLQLRIDWHLSLVFVLKCESSLFPLCSGFPKRLTESCILMSSTKSEPDA